MNLNKKVVVFAGLAALCFSGCGKRSNIQISDTADTIGMIADSEIMVHQGEIRPDDRHVSVDEYLNLSLRHAKLIFDAKSIEDSIIMEWQQDGNSKRINKLIDHYNSLVGVDKAMRDSLEFYEKLLKIDDDKPADLGKKSI